MTGRDWFHHPDGHPALDMPATYYLVAGVDRDAIWPDVRRRCELGHVVQIHDHQAGAGCVSTCETVRARRKHRPIAEVK